MVFMFNMVNISSIVSTATGASYSSKSDFLSITYSGSFTKVILYLIPPIDTTDKPHYCYAMCLLFENIIYRFSVF